MPLTDIQWILGHARLSTTQVYLTPVPDDVIAAVAAFHARRAAAAPPQPPGTGPATGRKRCRSCSGRHRERQPRPRRTSSVLFTRVPPGPAAPEGAQVMRQFPPRPGAERLAGDQAGPGAGIARLLAPPFRAGQPRAAQRQRSRGLGQVLDWLAGQPGEHLAGTLGRLGRRGGRRGWREPRRRWLAAAGQARAGEPAGSRPGRRAAAADLRGRDPAGHPGGCWPAGGLQLLAGEMARTRDPDALRPAPAGMRGRAGQPADPGPVAAPDRRHHGGQGRTGRRHHRRGLPGAGCRGAVASAARPQHGACTSTSCCASTGVLPPGAPASVRMFITRGQLSPAELIGQYGIECGPVRDLLVDYLRERQLAVGLRHPAEHGARPGQAVLARPGTPPSRHQLAAAVPGGGRRLEAADHRVKTAAGPRRRTPEARARTAAANALFTVRAFYLDIAQWAVDDPARWGQWAAPCPIRAGEIPHAKELSRRKARMDQRTRERLPGPARPRRGPPARSGHAAAARLAAATAARPGEAFTAGGQDTAPGGHGQRGSARTWAEDPAPADAAT